MVEHATSSGTFGIRLPVLDNHHPHLGPRAAGWLRHIHRKSTTPDDWSEDGKPSAWWDQTSQAPLLSFPRFDLSESSYALGIMCDQTPAWREVYADILSGLAERHITYWAAVDWLTQLGDDPRRGDYPQAWIDSLLPAHLVGRYNTPGWVANGVAPYGLQPDPIGADGNLFFKGWLNLVQSLYAYVTGEDKWGAPFQVAGIGRARFDWTQHRVVGLLVKQWEANPRGPHCENTKIWPFCLSAAGLGLQLYDRVFQRSSHVVYDRWLDENRNRYFRFDDKTGALTGVAFYHDPVIEYTHWQPPVGALPVCFYLAPQEPVFAETLYHAAVSSLGWNDPKKPILSAPEPRRMAVALTVAREFGDDVTAARLMAYAEEHFEPRYFGDGEFGFWFNLGEAWPRGQLSACAMVAEVGQPGAWSKLFRNPNLAKFAEPTLQDVDYPALGITQAWNDLAGGVLHVATYAGDSLHAGRPTTFRVTRLPDATALQVRCDGASFDGWRRDGDNAILVETSCAPHVFEIFTDYRGEAASTDEHGQRQRHDDGTKSRSRGAAGGGAQATGAPGGHIVPSPQPSCPCCTMAGG